MIIEAIKNIKIDKDMCWQMCVALCLTALIMIMPEMGMAQTALEPPSAISNTICTIVNQLTGPVGRGIATVAVVFVGIGLFLGKMSWGLAIAVGIGIGAIFGAAQLVELLAPQGSPSQNCEGAQAGVI